VVSVPPLATEALVLIAVYAIVWQGYKLRRRINGFAHVALLVFVLGTLLPQIVSALFRAGVVAPTPAAILADVAVTVPVVALACFRLGLEGRSPRDRVVVLVIASGVVLAALTVVLSLVTVADGVPIGIAGGGAEYGHPAGATSALLNSAYRVAVIFWVGLWVFPFTARPGTPPRLRRGMRIAAVGILAMGMVVTVGLVTGIQAVIAGHAVRGSLLPLLVTGEIVAGTCWAVGLSYPLVASRWAARRAARTQRRDLERLEPLWTSGLEAFPELRRPGDEAREPVDFRLQRRKGECFDCLHHLRLYEDTGAAASSRAAVELLEAALERYAQRHGESVWAAVDRRDPAAEQDVALLVELADLVADLRGAGVPAAQGE
jgi:hypothetical protein